MEQSKFYQIKNITEHEYTLVGCDGSVITCPIQDIDKSASAFTIQDAKDGDVLFAENFGNIGGCVFLFKGIDNWKFGAEDDRAVATGYCCTGITESGNTPFEIQEPDCIEIERVRPATKSQRDSLFAKMKEEGYEWDAEKKELKKLTQSVTKTSEQEPQSYKEAEKACLEYRRFREECGIKDPVMLDEIEEAYYNGATSIQKPTWSDEDERMCQETIDWLVNKCFPYALEEENPARESIKWLKSLKNRTTWKPSEEQMEIFKELVDDNDQRSFYPTLKSLYNDLKKLKEKQL